jgi:hypothetical protein
MDILKLRRILESSESELHLEALHRIPPPPKATPRWPRAL